MVKFSIHILLLSLWLSLFGLTTKGQAQNRNQYTCVSKQGIPRTVVDTKRGKIELIIWESQVFGSQWSPESRCQEVTQRFQDFSDAGNLRYVTTGKMNGYNVICVGDQRTNGYTCDRDGLLITLQPSDHPPSVMKDLFDVNNRVSKGPLRRLGPRPRRFVINLDEFLDDVPVVENTASETTTPSPSPSSIVPNSSSPNEMTIPDLLQ
ncbi:MAG: COP23 domain-containing protein [Microcystaceae cyanobacterium]